VAPTETVDVLILGAGIAGCALAYHLARRHVGPVVLYDPRTPAAGASGRAAGILTEQLWNQWDVEVARETHREYAELSRQWDPAAYQQNGFARFSRNPEAVPVLEEARERLRQWGVEVETIGPEDLSRHVPAGRFDDVQGGIISHHDACVTPSSITSLYAEGARQAGVTFAFGRPATSLALGPSAWELMAGGTPIRARRLVVSAGAWSKEILRRLERPLPLTPYRTQAATLKPAPAGSMEFPSVHDIDLDVYVRPEGPGRILAGDGTEKVEADPERFVPGGDAAFLGHLAESLAFRFPGWADSEVSGAWAGVCTATPDCRPFVGPMPGAPGLYALTGFNGFGVMRAGGAARRLADLLADGDNANAPREALGPVLPERVKGPIVPFPPRPGFTLEPGEDPRF
jgi:sarcosine oxidase subunit beta